MAELVRPPAPAPKSDGTPPPPHRKPPEISEDLRAAVDAVTSELPEGGVTAAPFITLMQRQAARESERRRRRLRIAAIAGAALVVLAGLHFVMTRVVFRAPAPEALREQAQQIATVLAGLYSSPQQIFAAGDASAAPTGEATAHDRRYIVTAALKLQQPLYIPANSNGTAAYRAMREALPAAQEQELKLKLFQTGERPVAPQMPLLLQMSHRAGDVVQVRVGLEAKRFGWQWRFQPVDFERRVASRTLEGSIRARFAGTPHLVFGAPGVLAETRRLTQQARGYILAVAKAVQAQAEAQAVGEPLSVVDPQAAAVDLANAVAIAEEIADRPALPEDAAGIDPNAPAVDPNAPAVSAEPPVDETPEEKVPAAPP